MSVLVGSRRTYVETFSLKDSVSTVKKTIQHRQGLPVKDQVLSFNGKVMSDHLPLAAHSIQDNGIIRVSLRMLGGNKGGEFDSPDSSRSEGRAHRAQLRAAVAAQTRALAEAQRLLAEAEAKAEGSEDDIQDDALLDQVLLSCFA